VDNIPEKTLIKIKDVHAASIKLYVNNQFVGTGYINPFMFDISSLVSTGQNDLKIVATTTLFNLMGPNWISGVEERTGISPETFVDFRHFTKEYKIMPFGIGEALILEAK